MDVVTKWAFRIGLLAALGVIVGSLCLTALDLIAPNGTGGNRQPAEAVVGALFVVFVALGIFVFISALRKLREVTRNLTPVMKIVAFGALAATNFFGGYIFFLLYPRLVRNKPG